MAYFDPMGVVCIFMFFWFWLVGKYSYTFFLNTNSTKVRQSNGIKERIEVILGLGQSNHNSQTPLSFHNKAL